MTRKIYLDPGHGAGRDGGAVNGMRTEAADVLRLCMLIADELKGQDVEVKLSRTVNTNAKITDDRIKEANAWGADYYLSVHRNSASASATGNEIWVITTATQSTVDKAATILSAVCAADGLKNRGVKKGTPQGYKDFAVNKDTKMPSALLELGFISNAEDNKVFDRCISDYAEGIAKALCEIAGVEFREKKIIKGDVNQDGKVNAADARKALRGAAELENLTDEQKEAADMNGDGVITAGDGRAILRESAGLK